jgi:MFS family permease
MIKFGNYFNYISAVRLLLWATFIESFATSLIIPLLGIYLISYLHLNATLVGTIVVIPMFFRQFFSTFFGILVDRIDVKSCLFYGSALSTLGYIIFLFAHSYQLAILAATIIGCSGSLFSVASKSGVAHYAECNKQIYAHRNLFLNLGAACGPLLAGIFITKYSYLFIVSIMFYLVLAMRIRYLPKFYQNKAKINFRDYLSKRGNFLNKKMILTTGMAFCFWVIYGAFYALLPLYGHIYYHNDMSVGMLFTFSTIVLICFQIVSIYFRLDKINNFTLIIVGYLIVAIGASVVYLHQNFITLYLFVGTFAIAEVLVFPSLLSMIAQSIDKKFFGLAYGINGAFSGFGVFIGGVIVGWVVPNFNVIFCGGAISIVIVAVICLCINSCYKLYSKSS